MIPLVLRHITTGWVLAFSKVRLQTKEHALGYGWAILTPIIYAVCFVVVKQSLVGKISIDNAHAWEVLRAFMGVSLFQLWFQLVQDMSELVRRRRSLLRGMTISEKPLIFAVIFEACIGLAIRLITIVLAILFLDLSFPVNLIGWGWFLISLCTLLVSASALGLILAPWAALYPDVGKSMRSINMPLILISPVFYPATTQVDSYLFLINCVNPLASILATMLDALMGNPPFYGYALLGWLLFGLLLILWSLHQLKRQIPILLERMGT
ncbi:MAG: ABC transporter permease [Nitrospirales bacterium]